MRRLYSPWPLRTGVELVFNEKSLCCCHSDILPPANMAYVHKSLISFIFATERIQRTSIISPKLCYHHCKGI